MGLNQVCGMWIKKIRGSSRGFQGLPEGLRSFSGSFQRVLGVFQEVPRFPKGIPKSIKDVSWVSGLPLFISASHKLMKHTCPSQVYGALIWLNLAIEKLHKRMYNICATEEFQSVPGGLRSVSSVSRDLRRYL